MSELNDMCEDGLVDLENHILKITDKGHPFIRNVAMSFDFYLRDQREKIRFSRTI